MVLKDLQQDFKGSNWKHEIDVRDFIQANYEPYAGDESFLTGPSEKTKKLWTMLSALFEVEREKESTTPRPSCPKASTPTEPDTSTRTARWWSAFRPTSL